MSVTKELIEQEAQLVKSGYFRDVHFHREGTFLRAYDWSAWLCCRYLPVPLDLQSSGTEYKHL